MARSLNHSHRNCPKTPNCDGFRSAAVDVAMMIAVIGAVGFLLFPHMRFVSVKLAEVSPVLVYLVKDEVAQAPLIYVSIGLTISCAGVAALACAPSKCGNPNCKGLRKAPEFHIQLETKSNPIGRAVVIFRGKCGCCVGRLKVVGTNKKRKKIKK